MDSELKSMLEAGQEEIKTLKNGQSESYAILKALEHSSEVHKADIEGIKAGQKEIKVDVEGIKADVEGIKAGQEETKADIEGIKADIEGLKAGQEELKTNQSTLNNILNLILTKIDDQTLKLDKIDTTTIDNINKKFDYLETRADLNTIAIENIKVKIKK